MKNITNFTLSCQAILVFSVLMTTITPVDSLADSPANADVVKVKASPQSTVQWRFDVTVRHPDTGWEDYADGWDVVLPGGTVVKPNPTEHFTRTLWHPHVGQQPFTRSQSGVTIPTSVDSVTVRAHDKVDGFGGKEMQVNLRELRQ